MSTNDSIMPRRLRRALYVVLPLWLLLALLWLAPAQLLPALLRAPLPQLQLSGVAGSFWHGRAASAQWRHSEQLFALGAIEWRLSPWSLLRLQPRLDVSADYGEQFVAASATLSPLGALSLQTLRAALPAASLRALSPLPVDGVVTLQLSQLSLRRGVVEALSGELQWQRAAWQWQQRWLPLGDYRCELSSPAVDRLQCRLQGGSAARIDGVFEVELSARRSRLDSALQLSRELPQQLRDGAGLMLGAEVDRDGRLQIERDGSW